MIVLAACPLCMPCPLPVNITCTRIKEKIKTTYSQQSVSFFGEECPHNVFINALLRYIAPPGKTPLFRRCVVRLFMRRKLAGSADSHAVQPYPACEERRSFRLFCSNAMCCTKTFSLDFFGNSNTQKLLARRLGRMAGLRVGCCEVSELALTLVTSGQACLADHVLRQLIFGICLLTDSDNDTLLQEEEERGCSSCCCPSLRLFDTSPDLWRDPCLQEDNPDITCHHHAAEVGLVSQQPPFQKGSSTKELPFEPKGTSVPVMCSSTNNSRQLS
eukprot:4643635-Amphidinium_carterae.1